VILLSSRISQNKILDDEGFSLSQWISISRSRLGGKILFVVFSSIISAKVDVFQWPKDRDYLCANL